MVDGERLLPEYALGMTAPQAAWMFGSPLARSAGKEALKFGLGQPFTL